MKEKECLYCGKSFISKFRDKNQKYCSRKCFGLACQGKGNPVYGRGGTFKGRKHSLKTRFKMSNRAKGSGNSQWKGGVSRESTKLRRTVEYKLWREAVFKRDNYTCVWCFRRGGCLNAHHIKSWKDYPELRFAIDNGRTLCEKCHKRTETYGYQG